MKEFRATLRNADKDGERLNPTAKNFILRVQNEEEAEKMLIDLAKVYFADIENVAYSIIEI